MLGSAFYSGIVTHTRLAPVRHQFRYQMLWACLNLDELDAVCTHFKFWSRNRFNLISFYDSDYIPKTEQKGPLTPTGLKQSVVQRIVHATGERFQGKIFILTQLRFLGYSFNPVTFFFCYNEVDQLAYTLAYITNTPWDETNTYVFKAPQHATSPNANAVNHEVDFKKTFHISPFNPMAMDYQWKFLLNETHIEIDMNAFTKGALKMNAYMRLYPKPISLKNALTLPLSYPFQGVKVISAIYWQAFKLWLKKAPYYSHPKYKAVASKANPGTSSESVDSIKPFIKPSIKKGAKE